MLANVAAASKRIDAFDVANAQLIAEAEQERLAIARDTPLKGTYDRFLEKLRSYRDRLPGQLMAGLNETALNLYNEFNRNDLDADKLAALHLPLTDDGKIEVTFRGDQDRRVDALHVLSEGHIRCLGLAILLAKAKSIDSPTIVFDDAINAIDHDHRGGIREAIFESDTFADTQIVVTCHSNEFIKDIQQHLPRERDSQVYLFRHHTGDHHPRVSGNVPTANYVAKARAARDVLNDREALSASRQALEMLARFLNGRNPVSSHVPVSNLRIVRRHALPLAAQDDGNWEMSIIKCDDRTFERATLRPARSHRISLHAIPSLRVVSCKYRGFLRMLRCLALDSAVARPVVNGPRPVQFRPLC